MTPCESVDRQSFIVKLRKTVFFVYIALCSPQHVHIAYGDSLDQVVIVWATKGDCSTLLEFGTSEWRLDQRATGTSVEFWEQNFRGLHFLHRVKLTVSYVIHFLEPHSSIGGLAYLTVFNSFATCTATFRLWGYGTTTRA